jgi:hypothetical protein
MGNAMETKKATPATNRGRGSRALSQDPESPAAANRFWLSQTMLLMSLSRTEVATCLVQSDQIAGPNQFRKAASTAFTPTGWKARIYDLWATT